MAKVVSVRDPQSVGPAALRPVVSSSRASAPREGFQVDLGGAAIAPVLPAGGVCGAAWPDKSSPQARFDVADDADGGTHACPAAGRPPQPLLEHVGAAVDEAAGEQNAGRDDPLRSASRVVAGCSNRSTAVTQEARSRQSATRSRPRRIAVAARSTARRIEDEGARRARAASVLSDNYISPSTTTTSPHRPRPETTG